MSIVKMTKMMIMSKKLKDPGMIYICISAFSNSSVHMSRQAAPGMEPPWVFIQRALPARKGTGLKPLTRLGTGV